MPEIAARHRPTPSRISFTAAASLVWVAAAGLACTGTLSPTGEGALGKPGTSSTSGSGGSGAPGTATGGAGPGTGTGGSSGSGGSSGMVGSGSGGSGVTGTGGAGMVNPGSGGAAPPVSACNGTISPGRSPLRRLNGVEYDNTLRDLTGTAKSYSDSFPPPELGSGFSNNADALVTNNLLAEGFERAAEEVAAAAIMNLGALAPTCNSTGSGAAMCAKSFIQAFGKKAFRRPLTTEEVTRYQAIYTTGSTGATYNDGISLVIEALLQSPYFLYRVEAGAGATANPAVVSLTPYELASRMSYFIWQSMPDDMLMAAAEAGQLSTPEQLSAQANRMLESDRSHQMVTQFHREWLFMTDVLVADKPITLHPEWTEKLVTDLFTEADTFVNQTFWNNGKVSTLLNAPYSYMNANVAAFYGLPAPKGTGFVQTTLDPTQRAGFLTQAAFLAGAGRPDQSSPVKRGKFVREQLLCNPIQPPPNNIIINIPEVVPGMTTRERFTQHDAEPLCASCHQFMDPIGYAFEGFDAIGRYRTTDNGFDVNTTGEVVGSSDPALNGPITGALDLAKKLADSSAVGACVAKQWFRWGTGRADVKEDACSIETVTKQLQASDYDMRVLPLAIVSTDAFRYRQAGGTQ